MFSAIATTISTIVRVPNWREIDSIRRVCSHSTTAHAMTPTSRLRARISAKRLEPAGIPFASGVVSKAPVIVTPMTTATTVTSAATANRRTSIERVAMSVAMMDAMIEEEHGAPLTHRSATWLARAIRDREVSSRDVVQACLDRIEQVNGSINAVVQLAPDALERAARADERLARGLIDGPLLGVPFTAKDSLDTAGLVSTAGTIGW